MYALTPVETDRIRAMPMMPIDPANEVSSVRPFLVLRLLKLSAMDVASDIEALPSLLCTGASDAPSSTSYGSESLRITPSRSWTVLVAYCSASSGLCVTMTTRRSFATSLSRFMICTDVSESSAPVGSSASTMSGSLTRARAMATRCICPPDSWFGFLLMWSPSPTCSRALRARSRRSVRDTPEIVSASSTFDRIVWCGIRL